MNIDDELLVRSLAKKLEIEYEKKSIKQKRKGLSLDEYFDDFKIALPLETNGISFESKLSTSLISFCTKVGGETIIYIDGGFLGTFTAMNSILCYKLSLHPETRKNDQDKLSHFFCEMVYGLQNTNRFGYLKRKMVWHTIKFRKMAPIIKGLTDGMMLFMLCHELAHYTLKHVDVAYTNEQEIEADTVGIKTYLDILEKSPLLERHLNYSYVLPYAPVLALQYLTFNAMSKGVDYWNQKSELLENRQLNLLNILEHQNDEESYYFYGDCQSKLLEIQSMLEANL